MTARLDDLWYGRSKVDDDAHVREATTRDSKRSRRVAAMRRVTAGTIISETMTTWGRNLLSLTGLAVAIYTVLDSLRVVGFPPVGTPLIDVCVSVLVAPLFPVAAAVAYDQLREARDGFHPSATPARGGSGFAFSS